MIIVFINILFSENSSPFCHFLDGCNCSIVYWLNAIRFTLSLENHYCSANPLTFWHENRFRFSVTRQFSVLSKWSMSSLVKLTQPILQEKCHHLGRNLRVMSSLIFKVICFAASLRSSSLFMVELLLLPLVWRLLNDFVDSGTVAAFCCCCSVDSVIGCAIDNSSRL